MATHHWWTGELTEHRRQMILGRARWIAWLSQLPPGFWFTRSKTHFEADMTALIVGALIARGFERDELRQGLNISNGKVGDAGVRYKMLPATLISASVNLSGELAPAAFLKVWNDDAC